MITRMSYQYQYQGAGIGIVLFGSHQRNFNCGLRFGIVLVLGIGIAQQFLSSIELVLVRLTWYSSSLVVEISISDSERRRKLFERKNI